MGCCIGDNLTLIDGAFSFENYDWMIYFTPDTPHMLKLGHNALSDMRVIIDENNEKISTLDSGTVGGGKSMRGRGDEKMKINRRGWNKREVGRY